MDDESYLEAASREAMMARRASRARRAALRGGEHVAREQDDDTSRAERQAARQALTHQAASHEDGPRERALRALAETALIISHDGRTILGASRDGPSEHPLYPMDDVRTHGSAARLLWTEAADVLIAGARDPLVAARREALRTITYLTYDDAVATAVWENEAARDALVVAASAGDEEAQAAAHSALSLISGLSLIPAQRRQQNTATSFWQHEPTRQVVLSTARRHLGQPTMQSSTAGQDGQQAPQAPLRVRLEAWDSLINSMASLMTFFRRGDVAEATELFMLLWFRVIDYALSLTSVDGAPDDEAGLIEASSVADVQAVVLSCLTDPAEEEQIKVNATGSKRPYRRAASRCCCCRRVLMLAC